MDLPAGVGFFRSERHRAEYLRMYDELRELGPAPAEILDVLTGFGTVRVYRFGPARGTPLMLLHGNGITALQWSPMIEALSAARPVYTLDMLGQPGRSQQIIPIRTGRDHCAWIDQLLRAVGLDDVHLGGASLGGWVALQMAAHHPQRVRTLTLIDPAGTLARVPGRFYLVVPALAYRGLPRTVSERVMRWMLGTPEHPNPWTPKLVDLGLHAVRAFHAPLFNPAYPSTATLRSIHTPTLALLAGRTVIHDTRRAARRAREVLPNCETHIWPEAGHGLPLEHADEVGQRTLDFIATSSPC